MRQVNYLATYSDHTHLEGFILINDNDFTAMSMDDVKAQIQKSIVTNLGGTVKNNYEQTKQENESPSIDSVDTTNDSATIKAE